MIVFGHRGAAGHAPENTLGSVELALEQGVDGVEIDVRLLDGQLIVLHDELLERTTSGQGHYKARSLADVRALDAGGGERVPLLQEVLDLVAGRVDLNVEVKEAGIAGEVVDLLATRSPSVRARILLSSFDEPTTAVLGERRGAMRLGVLYEGAFEAALERAARLRAWSLHLPLAQATPETVARTHGRGLAAFVYTVNTETELLRCARARVDGVFTDFPDRAVAFNRGEPS